MYSILSLVLGDAYLCCNFLGPLTFFLLSPPPKKNPFAQDHRIFLGGRGEPFLWMGTFCKPFFAAGSGGRIDGEREIKFKWLCGWCADVWNDNMDGWCIDNCIRINGGRTEVALAPPTCGSDTTHHWHVAPRMLLSSWKRFLNLILKEGKTVFGSHNFCLHLCKNEAQNKSSELGYISSTSSLSSNSYRWKLFDVESNINTVLRFFMIPGKKNPGKGKNLFPGMWVKEDNVNRFYHVQKQLLFYIKLVSEESQQVHSCI